ncbi:MAG: hypothetical protein N2558_01650 [Patescibacteria group bacterium]|nr:hypothetical protein [Patescibacteria group bacterium]
MEAIESLTPEKINRILEEIKLHVVNNIKNARFEPSPMSGKTIPNDNSGGDKSSQ